MSDWPASAGHDRICVVTHIYGYFNIGIERHSFASSKTSWEVVELRLPKGVAKLDHTNPNPGPFPRPSLLRPPLQTWRVFGRI